jgi:hypothetical protein
VIPGASWASSGGSARSAVSSATPAATVWARGGQARALQRRARALEVADAATPQAVEDGDRPVRRDPRDDLVAQVVDDGRARGA